MLSGFLLLVLMGFSFHTGQAPAHLRGFPGKGPLGQGEGGAARRENPLGDNANGVSGQSPSALVFWREN